MNRSLLISNFKPVCTKYMYVYIAHCHLYKSVSMYYL